MIVGTMIVGTWLSVVVLGPGAILVFLWFLVDLWKAARRRRGG